MEGTLTDLAAGLAALDEADPRVTEAKNMYEGTAPEIFASTRVAAYLKNTGQSFRLNWCRVVVTAVLNRLEIAAVTAVGALSVEDQAERALDPEAPSRGQAVLDDCWTRNRMGLLTRDMHEAALRDGETFAIVWPHAETGQPIIHHNSAEHVAVVYDPEDATRKLFAIKRWASGLRTRVNLYYPDRIERYISDGQEDDAGEEGWAGYWDEAAGETEKDWAPINPYNQVPVFHFRPQWPKARPEHRDAYGAQNGLNKLIASYFGTVDYQVAPQRYALTEKASAGSAADEDFGDIEDDEETASQQRPAGGPGTVWWLDNAKSAGVFPAAAPEVFWSPITQLQQHMAVITDTPSHAFQFGGTPPSGESRRAENEPLYAKVANRQIGLGPTWEELYGFVLLVAGVGGTVAVDWAPIDRADDKDGLEAAQAKRALGVPDEVILRELGYTSREMAEWSLIEEAPSEATTGGEVGPTLGSDGRSVATTPPA